MESRKDWFSSLERGGPGGAVMQPQIMTKPDRDCSRFIHGIYLLMRAMISLRRMKGGVKGGS